MRTAQLPSRPAHLCGEVDKHLLAALGAVLPDLIARQVGVHGQPHVLGLHTARHGMGGKGRG